MSKNNHKTSETGKEFIKKDEAQIDGLYDDPSGYCTFGIGHLVKKSKCYLLAAASADATLKSKLGSTKIGKSTITYVPTSLHGTEDLKKIKEKALETVRNEIAQKDYKKTYDKLGEGEKQKVDTKAEAALKQETDLLAKTAVGVFTDDLKPFEEAVNAAITGIELNQDEFDALVSFSFNVGTPSFKSSTLVKKINEAKYRSGDAKQREAAIQTIESEFKKWNKSGGKVLDGLTKRREKEAERFLKKAKEELAELKKQNAAAKPAPVKAGSK